MITLVKFKAEWCGPCKAMTKVMEPILEEYKNRIIFTDVDVDDNPDLRAQYVVNSIPTFIIIKDAVVVDRRNGSMTASAMRAWLDGFGNLQSEIFPEQP